MSHRFTAGDRVRVLLDNPAGNPRTPSYVRGKLGQVVAMHGQIPNPLDHRGVYPPLCTVAFPIRGLFGGASPDRLYLDLHEDWLEPA